MRSSNDLRNWLRETPEECARRLLAECRNRRVARHMAELCAHRFGWYFGNETAAQFYSRVAAVLSDA